MSGIPKGHAHAHTHTRPLGPPPSWLMAVVVLAHPRTSQGDGTTGRGGTTVCGRAVVAQRIKRMVAEWENRVVPCVDARVCVVALGAARASRELTSASPTGSWHAACPGLGQYYVHLACIYREGRLPVLHALPAERGLNTQRPRALVLQPKGVMEQSTDMIPPPHAWRHLSARAFFPVPPNARTTGTGADRERGWRWAMEHGWRGVRSDASSFTPHLTPHSPQERC